MIFLLTFKAETIATRALHDRLRSPVGFVDYVVAAFLRTPLQIPVFFSELLTMPLQILFPISDGITFLLLVSKVGHEEAMWHNHVTALLHTFEKHTFRIGFDCLLQVFLPAYFVKCMAANKVQWLEIFVIWFIITVADCTRSGIGPKRLIDLLIFEAQTLIVNESDF
jgi:hypothetical protein